VAGAGWLPACGSRRAPQPPAAAPTTFAPTGATTPPAPSTTRPSPPLAPLTGLLQPRASQLHAPAVVVKVDNIDAARPQTGVNQADVVYEELVEGGLTRLAAVFQSQYPAAVGPVRSGRLTDAGIADDLNHPVFAYSGTNAGFLPVLRAQPVTDVDDGNRPDLFWRSNLAAAPDNLYASVVSLAAASTTDAPPGPLLAYLAAGASFGGPGAAPVGRISINFAATLVTWDWSDSQQAWVRSQNGSADVDRSGVQLSAANVIVQFVPYVTSGMATGEGLPPAPIPTGQLVGRGAAWYLSAGRMVQGTWYRASLTGPTRFADASGAPVRFTPGRTWVELVPVGTLPTTAP
jgi:Protein of unknown function (DUF3048) N-terminal domain/Protein of unknown function (DUF3048) C-terminal domain